MIIGKCEKCGNDLYDSSAHCMRCGWKPTGKKIISQNTLTVGVVFLAFVLLLLATMTDIFTSKEEIQRKEVVKKEKEEAFLKRKADSDMIYMARNAVLSRLKDPNSADFGDVYRGSSGAVCGKVNAKNSFGGFMGFTRFVSGGMSAATFMESDQATAKNFPEVWDKMCKVSLQ